MTWNPVFCSGIPLMDWKTYIKKYIPLIYQMADFSHTSISRLAAANMLAATVNEAVKKHVVTESLLNSFFGLSQDSDLTIQKSMLKNYNILIPITNEKYIEEQLLSEVIFILCQLLGILKETNQSFRILIIETIIKNRKYLNSDHLVEEFLPLLIDEANKCFDFSEDWMVRNFGVIIDFILSLKIEGTDHILVFENFWHVVLYIRIESYYIR